VFQVTATTVTGALSEPRTALSNREVGVPVRLLVDEYEQRGVGDRDLTYTESP
jgi:hypothetical protein